MRLVLLWIFVFFTVALSAAPDKERDPKAAFLSEYLLINATHGHKLARNVSRVELFMEKAGVEAHSGYITVQNRSHMFFLFLKAPENISNAPLILWLQGGPGKSGLFGQFLENGPLGIDAQGELYNRSCSFQSFSNVLYVDYPAGGGFSVIENASVLSRSLMNVTNDLHSFLEQFYMLFRETYSLPLYIAGESYGARAAISLAQQLRTHITRAQKEEGCQNDQQKWKTHPLRGVILLSGFYVPLSDSVLKSEKYLYQLGMVDSQGRDQLAHNFELIRNLSQKNTTAALLLLAQTAMNMNVGRTKSLFSNLTGYSHQGSVLHPSLPQEVGRYINYVNMTKFKEALHIWPNTTLDRYRLALSFMLAPNDFFNDVTPILTSVLDSEKVLMINGQMDDVFPPVTFEKYMRNLSWTRSQEFRAAKRQPWLALPTCEMAGYVTVTEKLVSALVLKAGHNIGLEMCDATHDLVNRFVNNFSFSGSL